MKAYTVKSIFGPTIQGEGSACGTLVHFVRFSGCNQWDGRPETKAQSACPFCDTDFRGGDRLNAQEILQRLEALGKVEHIVLSGGEPALQVDDELIDFLSGFYTIHIETNGTKAIPGGIDHVTCSPKVPFEQLNLLYMTDLKLLYPPIGPEMTVENFDSVFADHKFLQPVWDDNYEANLKATIEKLKEFPAWRLSLQTHKMIGVE